MGATYILFVDYYGISAQWSKSKLAYFTNPIEIGAWFRNAGFTRQTFTVGRKSDTERYIVAIARTAHILTTMSYHVDRMLQNGGDDFAVSMAHQCTKDIRRWNDRAVSIVRRGTATGAGAERLPLRALAESAGLPAEGSGRWPD